MLVPGTAFWGRAATVGERTYERLAAFLAERGHAVYRFGISAAACPPRMRFADVGRHFGEAIALVADREGSDSGIGIVAHSDGGWVASAFAGRNPAVSFLVMLAVPGLPLIDIVRDQLQRSTSRSYAGGAVARASFDHVLGKLAALPDPSTAEATLNEAIRELRARDPDDDLLSAALLGLSMQSRRLTDPCFIDMLSVVPGDLLGGLPSGLRVYLLYGRKDRQVRPGKHARKMIEMLRGRVVRCQTLKVRKARATSPTIGCPPKGSRPGRSTSWAPSSRTHNRRPRPGTTVACRADGRVATPGALRVHPDADIAGRWLEWDARVRKHLPTFSLSDPDVAEHATLRDLLTHRTGLPRHDLLWYANRALSRADLIARLPHLELTAPFRTRFQYNNLMYMVAGHVAGIVDGRGWEEALRARILEPLGMHRTCFRIPELVSDSDHAVPYRADVPNGARRMDYRVLDGIGPVGGVSSSINEMASWLQLNLRAGRVGDRQVVGRAELGETHAPQVLTGATPTEPDTTGAAYGFGWFVDWYGGHRRLHHDGGIDGFSASVLLFPDDDIGIVAIDNGGTAIGPLVGRLVADRLLGLPEHDRLSAARQALMSAPTARREGRELASKRRAADTRPAHPLPAYVGRYVHPGYGIAEVSLDGDALVLRYGDFVAPLVHWHFDVWMAAFDGPERLAGTRVLFRTETDGTVAALEAQLEVGAARIVFRREPPAKLGDVEYLRRVVGDYVFPTGTALRIALQGRTLIARVAGHPPIRWTRRRAASSFAKRGACAALSR